MNGIADLTDFMDARYGVGGWTYRTTPHTGTDAGPAMSDALAWLTANTYAGGVLYIPPTGEFRVETPPAGDEYAGHLVTGAGAISSRVTLDHGSATLFRFTGKNGTGGGVERLNIHLEEDYATSTSQAIVCIGDAVDQPGELSFRDLYVTSYGASYWHNGLMVNGTARTSPQGSRVGHIERVQLFRNRNTGLYLSNVVQWTGQNIGVYSGSGTGNNAYITGGGTALKNSTQVDLRGLAISGDLNLTNATAVWLSGKCNRVVGATTFNDYDLSLSVSAAQSGTLGSSGRNFQM